MKRIVSGMVLAVLVAAMVGKTALACEPQAVMAAPSTSSQLLTDALQRVKREQSLALHLETRQRLAELRSEAVSAVAQGGAVGDSRGVKARL